MKGIRRPRLRRASATRLALELHFEVLPEGIEEFLLAQARQVLHHAVVVDDFELALREADCHEPVVFLRSVVGGVLGLLFGSHAGCGCGTVMSVGHIEGIHAAVEGGADTADQCVVVNHPEVVTEAVFGHEVIFGLACGDAAYDLIELSVVTEGEENRFYVGILDADVYHPVILLVLAGEFVFLYDS